ncbi:MAG: PHB depolymerase family esterase [Pseudomonadota bacterium]
MSVGEDHVKDNGEDHVIQHDGLQRTYKLYCPQNLPPNAPMVFVLHGMTSNSTWSYQAGFNDLADEHGFLAVYPQSHLKLIRFGKAGGHTPEPGEEDHTEWLGEKAKTCKEGESFMANGLEIVCQDGYLSTRMARWNNENADDLFDGQSDVAFLKVLARALQAEFNVSPEKTFVAGFSNGGYMSYTLMCQARDVFKAAGVVAGLIDADVLAQSTLAQPTPIIHIHGVDDSMVPISGEIDKETGQALYGARNIVEYFADLNNAVTTVETQVTENAHLTIWKPDVEAADQDAEVHYYRIENHDHVWPGSDPGDKAYEDTSGLNASALIWSFFRGL